MTAILSNRECVREETVKWILPRPRAFIEFIDLFGTDDNVELIDGAAVERNRVQLEHEKLLMWLLRLTGTYAEERNLGIVLGSRTAVQIHPFRGRLPDLLFVRQERMEIVQEKAVFGAPDLIVELISPGDRPSDVLALEIDYRSIGVAEIVFIDQRKRSVRLLRKNDQGYADEELYAGTLRFESLPGFRIEIEWLFAEPRPAVRQTLEALLQHGSEG